MTNLYSCVRTVCVAHLCVYSCIWAYIFAYTCVHVCGKRICTCMGLYVHIHICCLHIHIFVYFQIEVSDGGGGAAPRPVISPETENAREKRRVELRIEQPPRLNLNADLTTNATVSWIFHRRYK